MRNMATHTIDDGKVKLALQSILESNTFEDVNRLSAFLEYVVTEALKDRRTKIRAKIIAADVYQRRSSDEGDNEAIVRVDAGRLRRRLEIYYASEGLSNPVVISIPKGGYTPVFNLNPSVDNPSEPNQEPRQRLVPFSLLNVAAVVTIGCVAFWGGWLANKGSDGSKETPPAVAGSADYDPSAEIRLSISQISSASLLARTFVEEARQLTFPSIDSARPKAAEVLCKRAIELAPELAAGHSCDAFVQAFFAFVLPPGAAKATRLENARAEADTALRIDPADPYSLMADAWTQFAEGQRSEAVDKAATAVSLNAEEPFLRNFYGMMMTFEGRGVEILTSGLPNLTGDKTDGLYHPFVVAASRFQEQDYKGTLDAIDEAVALEGRTSQLITAIQISALENNGDAAEADKLAQNMYDTWKIRDVRGPLQRLYTRSSDVDQVAAPVEAVFARIGLQTTSNN